MTDLRYACASLSPLLHYTVFFTLLWENRPTRLMQSSLGVWNWLSGEYTGQTITHFPGQSHILKIPCSDISGTWKSVLALYWKFVFVCFYISNCSRVSSFRPFVCTCSMFLSLIHIYHSVVSSCLFTTCNLYRTLCVRVCVCVCVCVIDMRWW